MTNNQRPDRTKKSHIVPQNYLKRFSSDGTSLWVFDKVSGKTYRASIKDVAQDRGFYEISAGELENQDNSQAVEKYLANLEGTYRQVVDELLERYITEGLPDELRQPLAFFIALQALRTQEVRSRLNQFATASPDDLYTRAMRDGYVGPLPERELLEQLKTLSEAEKHATFLDPMNIFLVAEQLVNFIWLIGVHTDESYPLYTSDNPVVAQANKANDKLFGTGGLAAEGTEIILPLTPCVTLWLKERKWFAEHSSLDSSVISLSKDNIDCCNSFQISNAVRQVYCGTDFFDFARYYCDQVPAAVDPDRFNIGL